MHREGTRHRWLSHTGAAFLHRDRVGVMRPRVPAGMAFFATVTQTNGVLRRHNQRMVRRPRHLHGDEVKVVCAHDATQFHELAQKSGR